MPRPARFISEKRLPVEGAVQAPSSLARKDTSIAGAIGGIGQDVTRIGLNEKRIQDELARRNAAAIDANSKASAFGFYKLADEKFEAIQQATPTEEWEEKFNQFYSEADQQAAGLNMSEEARKAVRSQGQLSKFLNSERMAIQITAANTRRAVVSTGVVYESAMVDGGDIENAGAEHKDALISLLGEEKGIEAFQKKTKVVLEIRQEKDFNDAVGGAFDSWTKTDDIQTSFDLIAADPRIPEKDKQEAESELKTRVTNREADDKLKLEAKQEEQLGEINQLLYFDKDYESAKLSIQGSSLPEKAKGTLLADTERRADKVAKGLPIPNDRVEENRLYNLSLGIWNGSVTKKDFEIELNANAKKLDDEAFKRVSTSAATTLKTSQSQDLTRANTEASRQLVDFQSEDAFDKFIADSIVGKPTNVADAFKSKANEIRQAQFRELSNFNSELRDWIETNPDKTGKEFFQFSRGLENQYRLAKQSDTTLEQLRAIQGFDPHSEGFDLGTSKASGATPDTTGHLGSLDPRTGMVLKGINHPTIHKTFAAEKKLGNKIIFKEGRFFSVSENSEGDGLSLAEAKSISKPTTPATVEMISPDGRKGNVPLNKKQQFLDNGFKEI